MKWYQIGLAMIFASSVCLGQTDLSKRRQWESADGRKVSAQLLRVSGDRVSLKAGSGKIFQLSVDKLASSEGKLINSWKKKNPSGLNIPDGPYKWPSLYRGKTGFNVKYKKFDDKKGYHLYETAYFDFYVDEKLTEATLWKCIAIFYNVAGVLDVVPLHLEPIPKPGEKKYEVYLVGSDAKYRALGGPPNSGGFYDPKRNITVIPFSSLGIVRDGKKWKFDKRRSSYKTLIHELSHHLTYRKWPGQPCWLEEGMADFIAVTPFKGTEFSFAQPGKYLYDYVRNFFNGKPVMRQMFPGGNYQAISLEYIMQVPRSRWNQLLARDYLSGVRQYHTSMMVFYYFAFLDGKGDGAHLVQFMHAQRKAYVERKVQHEYTPALREKYLMRGRSFGELEKQMKEAFAKQKLFVDFR